MGQILEARHTHCTIRIGVSPSRTISGVAGPVSAARSGRGRLECDGFTQKAAPTTPRPYSVNGRLAVALVHSIEVTRLGLVAPFTKALTDAA